MSVPIQSDPPRNGPAPVASRTAAMVLLLALAARLLPFLVLVSRSSATWIYGRGLETGFVAHALLTGQGFASPFGGHTGPTALISPGYTLLVAAVFRLFGDASNTSAVVILLGQIVLGVLTTWFIMRLAGRIAGGRTAVIAGCFFALWPPLLWVPTIFWDTSFTLCLLPALLLLAMRLRERPSRALWLAFGALCASAVLINLALCPTVVAIFCWAGWNTARRPRHRYLAAALALLLYAPWPLRNAGVFHTFVPLRTTVGLELWMGNREGAAGFLDESVFPLYNRREWNAYTQRGEIAYMQDKSAAALATIRKHPLTFATLTARRVLRFWFGTGTRGGSAWYGLEAILTTLCGLAGLRLLQRARDRQDRQKAVLFVIPLLLFPLPYYLTHAEFRYRLALEPLLIPLAASFFAVRFDTPESSPLRCAPKVDLAPSQTQDAVVHA